MKVPFEEKWTNECSFEFNEKCKIVKLLECVKAKKKKSPSLWRCEKRQIIICVYEWER